jgi:hypothetical protein
MERLRSSQLVKSVSSPHYGAFCNSLNSFTGGSRNKYMYGRNPNAERHGQSSRARHAPQHRSRNSGAEKQNLLPSFPSFLPFLAVCNKDIPNYMYLIPN